MQNPPHYMAQYRTRSYRALTKIVCLGYCIPIVPKSVKKSKTVGVCEERLAGKWTSGIQPNHDYCNWDVVFFCKCESLMDLPYLTIQLQNISGLSALSIRPIYFYELKVSQLPRFMPMEPRLATVRYNLNTSWGSD